MRRTNANFLKALVGVGKAIQGETFARHRPVMNIFDKRGIVALGAFVAPNASIIGEAVVGSGVSVMYGAVIRADKNKVFIMNNSIIMDRAVLSTVSSLATGFPSAIKIGWECIIGPGAVLTSCELDKNVIVGAGAVIGEGSIIEKNCHIAAGAIVPAGTYIPAGQLWAGNPAKYVRDVSGYELDERPKNIEELINVGRVHDEEILPWGTTYQGVKNV